MDWHEQSGHLILYSIVKDILSFSCCYFQVGFIDFSKWLIMFVTSSRVSHEFVEICGNQQIWLFVWVGTTLRCQRKPAVLVLLCKRMLREFLWPYGWFKDSFLTSRTYKVCWGTVLRSYNLLTTVHGVLPIVGCSPSISSRKVGPNFGITSLSLGRWWREKSSVLHSPSIADDIMQLNLWWRTEHQGLYFGITTEKGLVLCRKGLDIFLWYLGTWEK